MNTATQACTNLKLRQLTRLVTRHYDHYIAAVGLKTTQYSLLFYAEKFGPIRPSDLARRMQMDASTLTRNMQPLVAQGWLEISAGADARSRLVQITDAGRNKLAEGLHAWELAQRELNQHLGAERVAALHALLDTCVESLCENHPTA